MQQGPENSGGWYWDPSQRQQESQTGWPRSRPQQWQQVPQPSQPLPPPPPYPQQPVYTPPMQMQPVMVTQPVAKVRNETMKIWAISLFAGGHLLAVVGALTVVIGIGVCLLPLAFLAEVAGFICLCLI